MCTYWSWNKFLIQNRFVIQQQVVKILEGKTRHKTRNPELTLKSAWIFKWSIDGVKKKVPAKGMQWIVIFDEPGSFTQKEFAGDSDGRFKNIYYLLDIKGSPIALQVMLSPQFWGSSSTGENTLSGWKDKSRIFVLTIKYSLFSLKLCFLTFTFLQTQVNMIDRCQRKASRRLTKSTHAVQSLWALSFGTFLWKGEDSSKSPYH